MTLKQELDYLAHLILNHVNGISIEELRHFLPSDLPKRTLQYRLSQLVKKGGIKREGKGKGTKYHSPYTRWAQLDHNVVWKFQETPGTYRVSALIPLSNEAQELKNLLSLPIQLRRPVSYQREFLDAYQPNKTFYLPAPTLEKLSRLGPGLEKERPAGTYARKMYQRLLIDLSWNSSRLEGNTYSLLETDRLLSMGKESPGKDHTDTRMILNHKQAIEFLVDMAEDVNINRHTILNLHALLSQELLSDDQACGRLRTLPVSIGLSVYYPLKTPQVIEECFQLIIDKAAAIQNPFEQSFFLMVHLPYLQPFLDVNKRVSRLTGNIPFIRENLSPLTFVDVPEEDYIQGLLAIYELNRIELLRDVFVWAYERSASLYVATLEALGPPDPFRIRYRPLIYSAVAEVIYQKMDKLAAAQFIATLAREQVPLEDRSRFIERAEIELRSLHEGNFARFRVRHSEFLAWQQGWQ